MTVAALFHSLGVSTDIHVEGGLAVKSPTSSAVIATLAMDTQHSIAKKTVQLRAAQQNFAGLKRDIRAALIEKYAAALKLHANILAEIIHLESGKTTKEALGEASGAGDVLLKTIADACLPEQAGMIRCKERPPVGVVGLITSFNFPIAVAHWTIAPALLAANSLLWKPSEKTPLTALACKAIFDGVAGEHKHLLEVAIGAREVGEWLVSSEEVDMVSATGSVAMGHGIKALLTKKKNNNVAPILELGGNNGIIISDQLSDTQLEWSLAAIMNSFLGTTGQRCTNTRRLIVHHNSLKQTISTLERFIKDFLKNPLDPDNVYGYNALIDEDAWKRFELAKKQVIAEGGSVLFGSRLASRGGFYVEPALALLSSQTPIMHMETFAPILFIAPYEGDIAEGCNLLNAPENSGLVAAIYTQSQREADFFAAHCDAGHALINPPKGTGTPAHGMGFGGNKHSGCGEILNSADPLAAFTRLGRYTRIAQNKEIELNDDPMSDDSKRKRKQT